MNENNDKTRKINAVRAADKTAEAVGTTTGTVFKVIGTVFLIIITSMLLFACIFAYYVKTSLTTSIGIRLEDFTLDQSSVILYETDDGAWEEYMSLSGTKKRIWVESDAIPQDMKDAVVAIEDRRFPTHKGVDWFRTAGAFVNMFIGMKNDFGGSTITQQLIKNVTQQDDITVQRKLLEIFQALELEKNYEKDDILLWYLNVVYFGEGSYGVQAAAQTYFGKDVSELSLAECAAIAGITNLPTYYDPFYSRQNNKDRQETILYEMYDQGYITKEEYDAAVAEKLNFVLGENEGYTQTIQSYYVETLVNDVVRDLMAQRGLSQGAAEQLVYNGGYRIYASIDPDIQAIVDSVYEDVASLPQTTYRNTDQQLQSGIVILDPETGDIVALSGGTGEKTINLGLNRATGSQRAPGSSIKPIAVYAPAIEYGLISPSTYVIDGDDETVTLEGTDWYPRNSGGSFGDNSVITITEALRRSLNTVSAQIMDKLTPQASYEFLINKLGVTSLVDADCDYAPLSLGELTYGITVREMAQAYSALANDGVMTYSRTYSQVTDAQGSIVLDNATRTVQSMSANTAHTMTYMLQNAATYGTGSEANLGSLMPVAGKTGTSSNSRDRWFCGYTPYYVAAVWTGYDTPAAMYFSGNPASQIWRRVMAQVSEGMAYKDFEVSHGGRATNIFGTLEELEELVAEEEPEETEDPEVSPGVSESPDNYYPLPTESDNPATSTPPEPSEPVSPPIETGIIIG